MAIGFPTNTVVAIIAAMIAASAGAWFSLARGLRRVPVAAHIERRWRWGAAIVLLTWLLIVLALAINPPGGAVLGAPYVIAFLGLGLLAGLLPLGSRISTAVVQNHCRAEYRYPMAAPAT